MKKKLEELLKRELIGMNIRVIGKNIQGKIIDETKNMFMVKTGRRTKRIIKKNSKMEFMINNERILVDGCKLVARPEDRIKLKVKA
jgi:RNase P/RNase MRP subunit p29